MKSKIAITTGDSDGIGMEVACKALFQIGPQPGIEFNLFYQNKSQEDYLRILKNKFKKNSLNLIMDSRSPAIWIQEIAEQQLRGDISGMVTGPLSKTEIKRAGLVDLGHTEILKRVTKSKSAYMCFLGSKFNVAIVTGHIPVQEISNGVTAEKILDVCSLVSEFMKVYDYKKSLRPIGLVGLNPHAGDSGLIGSEEKMISRVISRIQKSNIAISGPLVPDSCFLDSELRKYSCYVSMYHDQGLIPFKMGHGRSGAHLTLGIPIIRTSVDHGTARDIFGMNKANPHSMMDSIKLCLKLVRSKNV